MEDHKSIASELFMHLKVHEYCDYCPCIIERDAVRMRDYHSLSISNNHYIDLRYWFVNNVFNPCHVLDYFMQYSGLDCNELHRQVLDLIKKDREHWVHVASVVLPLRLQNFDEWLTAMENETTACDEFFLFALSRLHYRHTVVYTMKRSWTTLCIYSHMGEEEIHAACDLHHIYLDQDVYGLLVPTISPPSHIQTTGNGSNPTASLVSLPSQEELKPISQSSLQTTSTSVIPPLQAVILPLKLLVVEYL